MYLKLSFSYFKWVLQAILSLTVLSNCVSGSSNFDTAFCPDCTKYCSVFSCCWIGNLIRIPKMCLKLSFSYSKWVLQAILSLTVLSNCVSSSSNFDIAFYSDCTKFCSVFSCCWIGNLIRIVLKTIIFLLQVGLASNFVPDCQTVLKSCKNQG